MDADGVEAQVEEAVADYPDNVAVYSMVDDGEERESTYRTPSVLGSTRNSPHPPSFSVMLAKMDQRKRKKELSARTRHQHKSLEQALEEAPWRKPDDGSQLVEVSDATDDSLPLSALKTVDAKKTGIQEATKSSSSFLKENSSKGDNISWRWSIMDHGGLESCMTTTVPRPMTSVSITLSRSSTRIPKCSSMLSLRKVMSSASSIPRRPILYMFVVKVFT
eukprot:1490604-Amphidinium_carterae.2